MIEGDYGKFKVRVSSEADAIVLAPKLRDHDLGDIHSSHSAEDALLLGVRCGDCYSIVIDGELVGMFGRCVVSGGVLSIWLLASDSIFKIRRELVRQGRCFINKLIGVGSSGCNAVWSENAASLKWLKLMGAEFSSPMVIDGKDFLPFKIYNNYV